jgi:hypothetical protein
VRRRNQTVENHIQRRSNHHPIYGSKPILFVQGNAVERAEIVESTQTNTLKPFSCTTDRTFEAMADKEEDRPDGCRYISILDEF